uniref:hypothetical protein n=1 Tax=Castellaniella defragrans TaxID=75697 RepID=UPI00333EE634
MRQLVCTIWRRKTLIASLVIAGAALGVVASLLSTRYVSDSLFLTTGVSATNYKRLQSVFSSGARLREFLLSAGQADIADGALFHNLTDRPDALKAALKPEFAFTDQDQKTFGVKTVGGEEAGTLIGIRIQLAHKEPTQGAPVALLAEFIRDVAIRANFENTLLARCADFSTREQELRNEQLSSDFSISQEEKRVAILRDIMDHPSSAMADSSRQIVSLDKDGSEYFLSPVVQLTATELRIFDMQLEKASRERDRVASALMRDYYCKAQQAQQQAPTGRAFLEGLADIQVDVFRDQDKSIDIIEQTWNTLDVEREGWINTYLRRMRFVTSPQGAEVKERKPGLALGLVLGGVLGGMLGVFIALALAWWKNDEASSDATQA